MGLFWAPWRAEKTLVGTLATAAVALPFGVAVTLLLGFEDAAVVTFYEWLHVGDLAVDFAYRVDELSLLMTLVVTGIGALIHVYSMGYMKDDAGYWRFFAYLNLFIFAMLNLVLAENLVVLFLGWEGVGLCSYLLIG
ncbi:MAG: NADH-quinone oxidoreductase subunit L, partial [Bacteroidota bacterium]